LFAFDAHGGIATGYLDEIAWRRLAGSSLLSAIVDSSDDAIVGKTVDGVVTSWNPAAERMYGYSADEIVGKPITVLSPPERVGEIREILDKVGRGERVLHFETVRRRKDGSTLPVSVTVSPIHDEKGVLVGASSIARDISEQRNHAAELRRRARELELANEADQKAQRARLEAQLIQSQRLESVGRLAGGIAHDFNNMVGAMLNYAEFIKGQAAERAGRGIDKEAWEDTRRDAEQIESLGQRVIQRVRQLLAAGGQELVSPELIDLSQLLGRSEELLRGTLGSSIELHVALATRPCLVAADRGQLDQVLMELAANARDAMPAGGTCSAETRNTTIGPDEPELHPGLTPGNYACLIVRDSGPGMEPQVLEHAFEPFTTKPQVTGSGLGLAGVYGIISQIGGTVGISSAPGSTTITVWLPARPAPEQG